MKATCPKCGGALRVTDWRPQCPHCGVNMVDYNMQPRLLEDADAAELEFAHVQSLIDRVKASYIGSTKTKLRLAYALLPAAALFLPLAKLQYTAAYAQADLTVRAVSLVKLVIARFQSASPLAVQGFAVPPACAAAAFLSVACLLLTAVLLLVHIVLLGGSCTQAGRRRLYLCDALLLFGGVGSLAAFLAFASAVRAALPDVVAHCSVGVGAFLYLAMLLGVLIADLAVLRNGVEVRHTQSYVGAVPAEEFRTLLEVGFTGAQIHARYAAAQNPAVCVSDGSLAPPHTPM